MDRNKFIKKFPDIRTKYNDIGQQTHAVLIRMLQVFDYICNEINVDYWVDYGTLLGAIRHGGIIPWDTDIDIGMLARDFEKFKNFGAKMLPFDMFFQTAETDRYYASESLLVPAKIRDNLSSGCPVVNPLSHNGLNIDLYVYYYLADENYFVNSYAWKKQQSRNYLLPAELNCLEYRSLSDVIVPVPTGYDPYLRRRYGDYLELPPIENRRPIADVYPTVPCTHYTLLK